nr:unnamed protein product [Digitaria exilis]
MSSIRGGMSKGQAWSVKAMRVAVVWILSQLGSDRLVKSRANGTLACRRRTAQPFHGGGHAADPYAVCPTRPTRAISHDHTSNTDPYVMPVGTDTICNTPSPKAALPSPSVGADTPRLSAILRMRKDRLMSLVRPPAGNQTRPTKLLLDDHLSLSLWEPNAARTKARRSQDAGQRRQPFQAAPVQALAKCAATLLSRPSFPLASTLQVKPPGRPFTFLFVLFILYMLHDCPEYYAGEFCSTSCSVKSYEQRRSTTWPPLHPAILQYACGADDRKEFQAAVSTIS